MHQDKLPAVRDSDGTIHMYDPETNTFGSYNKDTTTRTFYKPYQADYFSRQIDKTLGRGGKIINPLPTGGGGGGADSIDNFTFPRRKPSLLE